LPGSQPPDDTEYQRVFGCPVKFDCKNAGMDLPREFIDLPVLAPDPESAVRFRAWAEDCLTKLPELRITGRQVTQCILSRFSDGAPSIQVVANELAVSPRTLQNLLAEEGTDYSTVLRQAREGLACVWLRENRSVEEITWMLGFAEPSVFRKAFKKWTGRTPMEFRQYRLDQRTSVSGSVNATGKRIV
jgi:AraC-like DNA-binding protein